PSFGHCIAAAINASCTASSEAEKSRNFRITMPSTCGASSRRRRWAWTSRVSVIAESSEHVLRRCAHHFPHLDRHVERTASRAGRRGGLGGDRVGALGAVDVDDPVAGEELLRLRENAVGDRLPVLAGAHSLRLIRPREALGGDELARLREL